MPDLTNKNTAERLHQLEEFVFPDVLSIPDADPAEFESVKLTVGQWLGQLDSSPSDAEIGEGNQAVYAKSDGNVYTREHGGSESALGGSSGTDTRVDIEDGAGTTIVSNAGAISFNQNLTVTDDGDGSVTIDASGGGGSVDIEEDGGVVVSGTDGINFTESGAATVSVTDDGDGSVTVDVSATDTNTQTDVSDDGTTAVSSVADINFASNVSVTDDGDGTVTINATDTNTDTDTHADVEDDGAVVVADVDAINFGSNISVTDDADGSVTVDASGSGDTRVETQQDDAQVYQDTTTINFDTTSAIALTDDGTGKITITATDTDTDTRTDVSDDGTTVVSETEDINFTGNLTVTDDTDGTVTVALADDISVTSLSAEVLNNADISPTAAANQGLETDGNGNLQLAATVTDGDGTDRQVWVIGNGASDPTGAGQDDIIFELADAFDILYTIDESNLFSKTGHVGLRSFNDVDGDGNQEFIMNIGSQADFAAVNLNDMTTVWRSTQNTTAGKMAYYPQVIDSEGVLVYGHRANDTVYCVELADGTLRWSHTTNGSLSSVEQADAGVVVGSDTEVAFIDYPNGSSLSGWPVSFSQHEQLLAAGDLDGDGQDEIVVNDSLGNIQVHNRDGTQRFSISSNHSHSDQTVIGDIAPDHTGNELLVVIDDDDSADGEGDEMVLFDDQGTELHRATLPAGGPSHAVDDFFPNQDGMEIAYGLETSNEVGFLDGTLTEQWSATLTDSYMEDGGLGQVSAGDINGDGELEIIANTGESSGSGFVVFDRDGNQLNHFLGYGWDTDPMNRMRNGAVGSKRFADMNGDGKDEYHAPSTPAKNTTTNDQIYIINMH